MKIKYKSFTNIYRFSMASLFCKNRIQILAMITHLHKKRGIHASSLAQVTVLIDVEAMVETFLKSFWHYLLDFLINLNSNTEKTP